jgi:translation initiation factor IF-3
MQFRGREMAHPELGSKILDDVLGHVGDHVRVETQARLEGRNMSMVLAPERKPVPKAAQPGPQGADAAPSGDGEQPGGNGLVSPATEPATTQPA